MQTWHQSRVRDVTLHRKSFLDEESRARLSLAVLRRCARPTPADGPRISTETPDKRQVRFAEVSGECVSR